MASYLRRYVVLSWQLGSHFLRPTGLSRFQHSRGATLLEVLVAIAIVASLVAIALPAVQATRESARRSQCSHTLRQYGIALHAHQNAARTLPKSVSPYREGVSSAVDASGRGWQVDLLPFLDQSNLYELFCKHGQGDFTSGGGFAQPDVIALINRGSPLLHCPSSTAADREVRQPFDYPFFTMTSTTYKGVLGDSRLGGALSRWRGREPDCHQTTSCRGLFFRNSYQSPTSLDGIPDGLSVTFAIGEDAPEYNPWSVAFFSNGDWGSTHGPLNVFDPRIDKRAWYDIMLFRSRHASGAHFLMADGAVRFVNERVDLGIYQAMSTRNCAEPVSLQ